jgi:hypothetical protein
VSCRLSNLCGSAAITAGTTTAGKVPDGIGAAKTPLPASDGAEATAGITGEAVILVDVRATDVRAVVAPADIPMLDVRADVLPLLVLLLVVPVVDALAVDTPVVDAPVAVDMAAADMVVAVTVVADVTSNS